MIPWWFSIKESDCQCRRCGFNPWVRKIPWRRKWQPTPVFLPGKSHRQRNLVGHSPWGRKRVRHGLATKQQIQIYMQKYKLSKLSAAAAKSLQSCPTVRPHRWQPTRLPRPWDSPGKNTGVGCHFFSNAWKWKVKVKLLSCVRLLVTPWTAAYQAPPSMGFSRQEYWSGVPLPSLLKVPRPLQNEASCQSYWHMYHLISFLFSQIASVKQMSRLWRCLYML